MHIDIFNIFFGFSLITILFFYTISHIKLYWHKDYVFIPSLTILIKFIFVIFFYFGSKDGLLHDANTFYIKPVDYYPFHLGNHMMFNIGYFLRTKMHLSYFNATFLLSLLSFYGLFLLLKCASTIYKNKKLNNFYYILFFFPSLHFWCIGFAKETFVFFSISLLCYRIFQREKISYLFFIIILIPIIFIRPHYVIFFASTVLIYNLLISDNKIKDLIKFMPIVLIGLYLLLITLDINPGNNFYLGTQDLLKYIEIRQMENVSQTLDWNISDYNSLQLTARFIYFPNILNILNINLLSIQSILLIENTILLAFSISLVLKYFNIKNSIKIKSLYVLVCLILAFAFSASIITANMGIIFRYKNLLYPIFIIMFLIILQKSSVIKVLNKTHKKFVKV